MKYVTKPVEIEAWKIERVTSDPNGIIAPVGQWLAELEGGMAVRIPLAGAGNHVPQVGDYWIKLSESDQYLCPKDVFERKYSEVVDGKNALLEAERFRTTLGYVKAGDKVYQLHDFGVALRWLKLGFRIARAGWNGKGMWLSFSPGSQNLPAEKFWSPHNRAFAESNGGQADVLPCITMKTADGKILMGWLASQTDMLAEDWMIVD